MKIRFIKEILIINKLTDFENKPLLLIAFVFPRFYANLKSQIFTPTLAMSFDGSSNT